MIYCCVGRGLTDAELDRLGEFLKGCKGDSSNVSAPSTLRAPKSPQLSVEIPEARKRGQIESLPLRHFYPV